MSYASDYIEDKVLNYMAGLSVLGTPPTDLHLALWNGNPGDDATGGTEQDVTGSGRVSFTDIQNGNYQIENDGVITIGTADGSYTVDYFAVFDAATLGNLIWYGPLDQTYNLVLNDEVTVADAALYGLITVASRGLGQSMRNWVFEWIGGTNNFAGLPSAWYVSLWNGDPESGGSEVTTSIRPSGRPQVTGWTKTLNEIANDNVVDFGAADNTTNYTYLAVYVDPTSTAADDLLFKKNLGASSVNKATNLKIAIGDLTFTYD